MLIGVLWALAPARAGAIHRGRPSVVMLVLVFAAAVPLALYGVEQAELQRTDHTTEHAAFFHWVEASFYAVAVILVGALGALRPAAFRLATWCGGLALAILGGASAGLGQHASALAAPWSWAALAGGIAFAAVGEWEVRRVGNG